ncbi:aldolase [bacterium]|nr:aldolase [bacterium]
MNVRVGERVWLDEEEVLREQLVALAEDCGAVSLKVSTEDAGMSYGEIRTVHRLFHDILPLSAKIGGPEARQDMRAVVDIGCRGVVAPMIESPYSLKKFIESLREELGEKVYGFVRKQINIETETACRNLDRIFAQPEISEIDQITVGRTDLCRSLGKDPDHPEVMSRVAAVVTAAKSREIEVSVGGRITPKDAQRLMETSAPTLLNTRDVGFDPAACADLPAAIRSILDFEIAVLEHQKLSGRRAVAALANRITKLRGRKNR